MEELIRIENGKITARELYDFLQLAPSQFSRWAKSNIEENEFYQEGIDWQGFDMMSSGNETRDYQLTIEFAKHLCMLSRSIRGKMARNYFLEVEKRFQQLPQMSQVQIIAAIAANAAEQERKLNDLAEKTETIDRRLTLVKDTIVQRDDNWRENINAMINKIVNHSGKSYQDIRKESYEMLKQRAACDLAARMRNLQKRLSDRGETKTKINNLTRMDVIEADTRLKEIFTSIVKELTISYVA